jgi:lysophospholipase L1-like esterase
VYGATITPFGGNSYDVGTNEAARQTVNSWIRTGKKFDAVVDFDRAVRNPSNGRVLQSKYDSGDHLHLNPTGYQALADSIPDDLFTH